MRRPLSILAMFTLLWVSAAGAQEAPGGLGVYDAIQLAEQQSPVLNQLRAQIDAKGGQRLAGYGIYTPELRYVREGIPNGQGGFLEQRWGISQSIDFPLVSYYRVKRINTETEALRLQLEAETRNLKAHVKNAYTELVYALEMVHLRQEEVSLSQQLLQEVQARIEVGEAAELDQIKVEIELLDAQSSFDEALRVFQQSRYALFNTIGLDPLQQTYDIAFPDTLIYFEVDIDEPTLLATLTQQPEYFSAMEAVEAAQFGVKQSRSALLPKINLEYYTQDLIGNGYNFHGFEVGLNIPLWFFLNNNGATRQAKAEAQRRNWAQQAVYLDLKKEIEQTWHSYETSKRTIQRYSLEVHGRATEMLQLTREGYELGEIDLLSLLDTQRTYLSSRKRYYEALRAYYLDLIQLERFLREDLVFVP